MKNLYRISLVALLFIFCISSYAQTNNSQENQQTKTTNKKKGKKKKFSNEDRPTVLKDLYFFGVARNYHDSITYITNISPIKKVVCDKATGFVDGLNQYTNQLETYLLQQGHSGYLCATFYTKSMKSAEKLYIKLKKKIDKKGYTHVEPLGEFMYQFVSPENIYRNVIKKGIDDNDEN